MVCKNCNTAFNDTQNFCFECGAKVIRNRLKPKVLVEQVNEEFLSADNYLLKTFIHLFTKPEVVIVGYIEGTRKKYINVIQYFAIGLSLLGVQVFFMSNVFNDPELYKLAFFEEMAKISGQENNPFLNTNPENSDDFNSLQSLFYTLSVPFSAFTTWLTYWIIGSRRFNFTEHLVINLYYSAQVVIISAVIYIITLGLGYNYFHTSFCITGLTFIYFFYVFKRVFNTSFWTSVLNFILFVIISSILLLAVTITGSIIFFLIKIAFKL
jgi:hypothetical protein